MSPDLRMRHWGNQIVLKTVWMGIRGMRGRHFTKDKVRNYKVELRHKCLERAKPLTFT